MKMKNDFTKEELLKYRNRYQYKNLDFKPTNKGYLTKKEFLKIAEWKTPRPIKHYQKNSDEYVKEITTIAFAPDTSEKLRIESLCILDGVRYPVASSILHFAYRPDYYPIIDFRAIWSLGIEVKNKGYYTFDIWDKYCDECRKLSLKVRDMGLSDTPIRIVDKALWQFSKDNQSSVNYN